MSSNTITISELIDMNFDFGLDTYTIFDENYRSVLNKSLLEYFYYREICYINPYQWKQQLNFKMDFLMRNKYNPLFEIKKTEFNPLYNIELIETFDHTVNNENTNNSIQSQSATSKDNSKDTSNSTNISDTEQTSKGDTTNQNINSIFPNQSTNEFDLSSYDFVEGGTKANTTDNSIVNNKTNTTNNDITITDSNSITDMNATINDTGSHKQVESYTKTTKGSSAGLPFSKALIQFKEFINKYNLEQELFEDLEDLFIQIF